MVRLRMKPGVKPITLLLTNGAWLPLTNEWQDIDDSLMRDVAWENVEIEAERVVDKVLSQSLENHTEAPTTAEIPVADETFVSEAPPIAEVPAVAVDKARPGRPRKEVQ